MQVENFYTAAPDDSHPLILLTVEAISKLPIVEQNYLSSVQFKGLLGDVCIRCDDSGKMRQVYIGMENDSAAQALMYAVNRLPAARYAVEQTDLPNVAMVGWALAQYVFDHYKPATTDARVLFIPKAKYQDVIAECKAIFLARDLINEPANALTPEALAAVMVGMGQTYGAVVQQYIGEELLAHNFPAIHAVGRAASSAPRLISLVWGEETHPKVTLVGKGVCFDSGGLDIKPSSYMRLMKKDMGGAAIVLGLAQWLMERRLPIRLHVLVPAVENAVGADAYRPGDVLTMRNGLTVEIDNTDAEGRLILADALALACEEQPELLIDFATLTGAARTAVGTGISAFFTNDDHLADDLMKMANITRDAMWRLPLFDEYKELFASSIADMANSSGSPYAGAITAALFLKCFVNTTIPWVHVDTMAWNVTGKPGKPEGGEAMGLQTVGQYLFKRYGGEASIV